MNGNPYSSAFVGATGIYQVQQDIETFKKSVVLDSVGNTFIKAPANKYIYFYSSNNTKIDNFGLSVYNGISWLNVPQTLTSLNTNTSTNTNEIAVLDGVVAGLTTITTAHSEQISVLQATDVSLSGSVATLTATTVALANDKLNKTSLDGISVIYRDSAGNVQLKYNTAHFTEASLQTTNTREFKLNDTYANLPTTKQDNLTFNSPLTKTGNSVSIDLSSTSNYASNLVYTSSNSLNTSIITNSNNAFTNSCTYSSNLVYNTSNLLNSGFSGAFSSSTSYSSNLVYTTSNSLITSINTTATNLGSSITTASNNCIAYTNNNFLTSANALNTFYTKTQINYSVATNFLSSKVLDVFPDTTNPVLESILNISNLICVKKKSNLTANYNEYIISIGDGNASQIGLMEGYGVPILYSTPSFSGIKFHLDNKILLNALNRLVINSTEQIFMTGNTINLSATTINLAGDVKSNGKLTAKAPIYFTTNRTITFNSKSYLACDIDLSLYTNKLTLDGYSHRHFRAKIFFSNGRVDYQWAPTHYNIAMTTYNTLSIYAVSNQEIANELNSTFCPYFLYRNSIDKIFFCADTSLFGSTNIKVYIIFEDLL